jgi:hypothetical protein
MEHCSIAALQHCSIAALQHCSIAFTKPMTDSVNKSLSAN